MKTLPPCPTHPDAEQRVMDALRLVIDPEMDCNIVDLGLVYAVAVEGGRVRIDLTVTTPGCPMTAVIGEGATRVVEALPFAGSVEIRWVWDPPWTPERMTPEGRVRVGWG